MPRCFRKRATSLRLMMAATIDISPLHWNMSLLREFFNLDCGLALSEFQAMALFS